MVSTTPPAELQESSIEHKLIQTIARCENLDVAGQAFLSEVLSTFGARYARLHFYDETTGTSSVLAAAGELVNTSSYDLIDRVIATRAPASSEASYAIPVTDHHQMLGALECSLAGDTPPGPQHLKQASSLNDLWAVLVRTMLAERERSNIDARWRSSAAASHKIAKMMMIVPPQQLLASLQRGFETWSFRDSLPLPDFFRSTMQTIVDQLRCIVGAEMTALGIGRFPSESFDPWIYSGVPEELVSKLGRNPRPIGLLGLAAVQGKTIRVRKAASHPDFLGVPPGHPEIKSFLAVPVVAGSVSLGTLYAGNKLNAAEFSLEDELATDELADFVVAAIQQAYFYSSFEIQQAHIQSLLDSAPSGMLFVDAASGHIIGNAAAVDLFGTNLTTKGGREQYLSRLRAGDGLSISLDELPSSQALQGKTVLGREMLIQRAAGDPLSIRVNAAPVYGFQNQIIGAAVVFENISSQKEMEKFRLELANMLVHDLRNPVSALKMSLEILMDQISKECEAAQLVGPMDRSINRLDQMISELIEVARIESNQITLTLEQADICSFVGGVLTRIRPAYPDRLIQYRCIQSSKVKIDLGRMDQVLTNLVDNAVKYSAAGSPVIVEVDQQNQGAVVRVKDHGQGLSSEQIERVFDRYFRAKRAEGTGLGLGLYITKGLVSAHAGRISVESTLGNGSTFCVWLPGLDYPLEET